MEICRSRPSPLYQNLWGVLQGILQSGSLMEIFLHIWLVCHTHLDGRKPSPISCPPHIPSILHTPSANKFINFLKITVDEVLLHVEDLLNEPLHRGDHLVHELKEGQVYDNLIFDDPHGTSDSEIN